MPFEYVEATGEWLKLQDWAAMGEPIKFTKGFLIDEPENQYKGKASPRYVIKGVASDGTEVNVSSPKLSSNDQELGRTRLLRELSEYLSTAPEGTYVELVAKSTEGSQYVALEVAGEGIAA